MSKELRQSFFILLLFSVIGGVGFLLSSFGAPKALSDLDVQSQVAAVTFSGKEYYVTPNGTSGGNGTMDRPWDLKTALAHPSVVKPGDVIWVRKGTYRGEFYSKLRGTASSPVVIRAYPGERVTIDGGDTKGRGILLVDGAYAWYWGLEIMSSVPKRVTSTSGSWPNGTEIPRGDGVQFVQQTGSGVGVKFINSIIHDTRQGMSFWYQAVGAEIYGTLIYYNGWDAPDRAHGHGIYTQNITGTKLIEDNIIFKQFSDGIQAYGTSNTYIYNYMVRGNTIFDNGVIAGDNGGGSNMQVGGGNPVKNFTITNNYFYRSQGSNGTVNIGQANNNEDIYVTNNYIDSVIRFNGWKRLTFTNNTIVGNNMLLDLRPITTQSNIKNLGYNWTSNKYFSVEGQYKPFLLISTDTGTRSYMFPEWRSITSLDSLSTYTRGKPTGLNVFVRPNKYETGRANITIYNWNKTGSVSVPLAGTGLKVGDKFEIRDAQNFFGAPVVTGTWTGGNVSIPMSGLSPAPTVGTVTTPPKHTGPEFGVFVLIPPESTGMGSYSGNPGGEDAAGAIPSEYYQTPPSTYTPPPTSTTPPPPGPDTTAPTVSISQSPPTASRGTITLGAFAHDNVAIKSVQFIIDGSVIGTVTTPVSASAPNIYYYQWNTSSVSLGNHTLTIRATDTSNRSAVSEPATITIVAGSTGGNDTVAPLVAITSPSANARVSGSVYVAAYASDNIGVVRVQFLVDGDVVGVLPLSNLYASAALAQERSYYSFVWDTLTVPVGTHTLSAQATDGADNVTISSPVTVIVERPVAVGSGTQSGGQGGAAPQSLPPPGSGSGQGMVPGTSNPIVIPNPLKAPSITCFLKDVLDIIFILGSILIVLVLIFAGLLFITAQGNPAKIKTAKSAFFTAIIGAALILGAWALGQLIATTVQQIGPVPSEMESCNNA